MGEDEVTLLVLLTQILQDVIPLMIDPRKRFLQHVTRDLIKMIKTTKHLKILASVVPCFCAIIQKVTENIPLLFDIVKKFYKFLYERRKNPKFNGPGLRC